MEFLGSAVKHKRVATKLVENVRVLEVKDISLEIEVDRAIIQRRVESESIVL